MPDAAPYLLPMDPKDAAFLALTDRILAARTREDLVALVPDILAATGGRVTLDYGELWGQRWDAVTGGQPYPQDLWPNA